MFELELKINAADKKDQNPVALTAGFFIFIFLIVRIIDLILKTLKPFSFSNY